MKKLPIYFLLLLGAASTPACGTNVTEGTPAQNTFSNPSEIASGSSTKIAGGKMVAGALPQPVAQWELPDELREVSGIALLPNNIMACIQDEEGAIYLYDLNQKKVNRKISFAGPGDYEGIVVTGNTAYILRSDGTIFEAADFLGNQPKVTAHKPGSASIQDAEGLALDEPNKRLLIASKGYDAGLGDNKGLYAFSLETKKIQETPVITVPLAQEHFAGKGKKNKDKQKAFQPSSLELDPGSGLLYVVDSANGRLLLLNASGEVQKTVDLDKKQLGQPEGLTFGSNGEMYISSEGGKKGNGVIVKYPKGIH